MANKPYAQEWLSFAKRNLDTAKLLYNVNHYTDIIGCELQQALEKTLKAILAYNNTKIPKEHDLVKVYFLVENFFNFTDKELLLLKMATNYYKNERYPTPHFSLPPKEEIKEVLDFTCEVFDTVCATLQIKHKELE